MSGPIVRRYGFPNFEKIFGPREMEHGADEDEAPEPAAEKSAAEKPAAAETQAPSATHEAARPAPEAPRDKPRA